MEKSQRKRKKTKTIKKLSTSAILDGNTNRVVTLNRNNSNEPWPSKRAKHFIEKFQLENDDSTEKKKKKKRRKKRKLYIETSSVVEGKTSLKLSNSAGEHGDVEARRCKIERGAALSCMVRNETVKSQRPESICKKTASSIDLHNDVRGYEGVSRATTNRNGNKNKTPSFKERLQNKLESGRFRWINEKLYTSNSKCASDLFTSDPALFDVYHQGFSSQVQKWPINPVDIMIKWIKKRSPKLIIVDMGCGDAKISQSVPNKVHSFDLVAANEFVTACDMAKVPLPDSSVHVVIYCLSLMGTNLNDFLKEAHRILQSGGIMKVAEVVSRFDDMENFEKAVCRFGFSLESKDMTNKMFVEFEFKKVFEKRNPMNMLPISLKPCLYKKR